MSAEVIDLSKIVQMPDVLLTYNPSESRIEQPIDGNVIVFAAANEDLYGYGMGVTPIKGHTRVWKKRKTIASAEPVTAREKLELLCGPDGRSGSLGRAGVRPLTGNPETDEAIKAEARKTWREKRYVDAMNVIRVHEAQNTASERDPSIEKPVYTDKIREAYRIAREEAMAGHAVVPTHPCPICNAPHFNEHQLEVHVSEAHGQKESKKSDSQDGLVNVLAGIMAQNQQIIDRLMKSEPEKPKRGRPRKVKPETE